MKVEQLLYNQGKLIRNESSDQINDKDAALVLAFGAKQIVEGKDLYSLFRNKYPVAEIVVASTSGEVYNDIVYENTVSAVAIWFEKTTIKTVSININNSPNSFEAGIELFKQLITSDLKYILVISDGVQVNGSELVRGLELSNTGNIPITGGLAGDADKFDYTVVGCNEVPDKGNIVAIGFYGESLKISHGSFGGWQIFGPEKLVTKSVSNRLYEIDNKSALDLYKLYLGKYAEELPGSALLFPLSVRIEGSTDTVVRTIVSIDNNEQCMVFAGDVPEGSYVKFMKSNTDILIDAASQAAGNTLVGLDDLNATKPKLALLISCLGRKLILGTRTEEEIEAVREVFGEKTILSGFYSYGEISPLTPHTKCQLHNQTMTITTFNED